MDLNLCFHLEASWAPVDELDGPLGLDGGDSGVDVFGDDVASVEQAAGHVLPSPGVTLHHLVRRLKATVCYLSHRELFMVGLNKD